MRKIKLFLSLIVFSVLAFWSCQSNQMPVENEWNSAPSPLMKITSAKLFLNLEGFNGFTSGDRIDIHLLTQDWSEVDVTWNFPNSWNGGTYDASFVQFDPLNPTEMAAGIDITAFAQAWEEDPASNFGLLLKIHNTETFPNEMRYVRFWSKDKIADPNLGPQIVVDGGIPILATDDSYIWENNEDRNYGSRDLIYVGMNMGYEKRGLLKFVLPPSDEGCTLTQGYWKTHGEKLDKKGNPSKKYDDTWESIGPDGSGELFYPDDIKDQTYMEVLNTSAADGNAYYILAYQFIAAKLNMENASAPQVVIDAFNEAHDLFNNPANTPEAVKDFVDPERQNWIDIKDVLDDYNNGLIGPGHCDD